LLATTTKRIDISDDSALARLGITYGVLRRLGYSEETVERCLAATDGTDLEEAHEWVRGFYRVHGTRMSRSSNSFSCTVPMTSFNRILVSYHDLNTTSFQIDSVLVPGSLDSSKPSTPRPRPSPALPTPSDTPRAGSDARESTPSTSQPGPNRLVGEQQVPTIWRRSTDLFSFPELLDDCDDPNIGYARLKLELDEAMRNSRSNLADPFVVDLRARLQAMRSHYLFDQRDANAHYASERQKVEAAVLQARLRGDPDVADMQSSAPSPPDPQQRLRQPKESRIDQDDIFNTSGDEGGGLLEILDEMPSAAVTETGITVRIRDMPLPKAKFERTSKAFLQAAVNKLDNFAVTTYHPISGLSRAKRASVRVRWSSGSVSEWAMTDVACHDMAQAEQYIATVALHALTFPSSEGFASGNLSPGTGQTFFRLLAPAFRELWDELEGIRKSSDDATNRAIWAKLKKIVEAKSNQGKVRPRLLGHDNIAQLRRLSKEVPRYKLDVPRDPLWRKTPERKRHLPKSSSPSRLDGHLHHTRQCW
jgi:ATP-dependent RNA helicase DHX29